MWILPSHVIISIIRSDACGACGVGSVFSPNEEIFVKTAVFFLEKTIVSSKTLREREEREEGAVLM